MSWLDDKYRTLMLWSMAIELLLLLFITVADGMLVWLELRR